MLDLVAIFFMKALLVYALQLSDPEAARLRARQYLAQHPQTDWQAVLRWAAWHGVRPQLLQGVSDFVPAAVLADLQAFHRSNAIRQMANAAMFLKLRTRAAGVPLIPFKGFWLAHLAYGQMADRESGDVDIFIDPSQASQVGKQLLALGFQPMAGYLPEQSPEEIIREFGQYSFDYFEGDQRLYHIELHATLGKPSQRLDISLKTLADTVALADFSAHALPVFHPSAQLLLAALHHGSKDAWGSLRQVYDIACLLHRQGDRLDWPWLLDKLSHYRAERAFFTGLGLVEKICGISPPEQVKAFVHRRRIRALVEDRWAKLQKPPESWTPLQLSIMRWKFIFRCRPHWADKWAWFWEYAEWITRPQAEETQAAHPIVGAIMWLRRKAKAKS